MERTDSESYGLKENKKICTYKKARSAFKNFLLPAKFSSLRSERQTLTYKKMRTYEKSAKHNTELITYEKSAKHNTELITYEKGEKHNKELITCKNMCTYKRSMKHNAELNMKKSSSIIACDFVLYM